WAPRPYAGKRPARARRPCHDTIDVTYLLTEIYDPSGTAISNKLKNVPRGTFAKRTTVISKRSRSACPPDASGSSALFVEADGNPPSMGRGREDRPAARLPGPLPCAPTGCTT